MPGFQDTVRRTRMQMERDRCFEQKTDGKSERLFGDFQGKPFPAGLQIASLKELLDSGSVKPLDGRKKLRVQTHFVEQARPRHNWPRETWPLRRWQKEMASV